jgi:hypothetical protein
MRWPDDHQAQLTKCLNSYGTFGQEARLRTEWVFLPRAYCQYLNSGGDKR